MYCHILLMIHGWVMHVSFIHERGVIVKLVRGFVETSIIIHSTIYFALYPIVHHWAQVGQIIVI